MNINIFETNKVSAVICTWNSIKSIEECLKYLKLNKVGEIIVVDADSTDGTSEVVTRYADIVLSDPREGLALARNIGITKATKEFILNVGADNIMPAGSIQKMLNYLNENNLTGVSAVTKIKSDNDNYIAKSLNIYKAARFYPGIRKVIGTPTLFRTETLKNYPYDRKMSWSDDGDLCSRLGEQGYLFAIANVICFELGTTDFKDVLYRWKGYGKSDWEIYKKNSANWDFIRKIKSFTYPLINELILPLIKVKLRDRITILPFLVFITAIRYLSWIGYSIKFKKLLE